MQVLVVYPRLDLQLSLDPLQDLCSCCCIGDMRQLLTYPLQLVDCLHAPYMPKYSATLQAQNKGHCLATARSEGQKRLVTAYLLQHCLDCCAVFCGYCSRRLNRWLSMQTVQHSYDGYQYGKDYRMLSRRFSLIPTASAKTAPIQRART